MLRPEKLTDLRAIISEGNADELQNAAFHLLWHVKELARDREPITLDKVG